MRALSAAALACAVITTGGVSAGAAPTTTPPAAPPTTAVEAPPEATARQAPTTTPAPTAEPGGAGESTPAESSGPAPQQPSGEQVLAAEEAPPSAAASAGMAAPQRADGRPSAEVTGTATRGGAAPDLGRALALENTPTQELPPLPAGRTARAPREALPEGFTAADAERSERIALALQTMSSGCQTYWPSPHLVCGAIRDRYNAMGAQFSWLGLPNSPEYTNPDGVGKRSQFANGSIYWHPSTGAHPVTILYMTKWSQLGWEGGWLGYPTAGETSYGPLGSKQEFQGAGLFWSQPTGVYAVGGAIRAKYDTVGGAGGYLGYPITDEVVLPDGVGRMNRFQQGVIYWHPTYGAHPITGIILASWEFNGYETGVLGYPASDQYENNGFPEQIFANHVMDVEQGLGVPSAPSGPAARNSSGQIEFYSGDAYRDSNNIVGIFGARRAADGLDTRLISTDWSLKESFILSKTAYGWNTKMDCTGYFYNAETKRFLSQDRGDRHKNLPINYRYHLSQSGHDDNTDYQVMMGCSFPNNTLKRAGNGTLAYGITLAHYTMAYIFRIR